MAGEMSQSEVTRDAYPGLFSLRDALKRRGIASEPRAFDQYQGPYLNIDYVGKVWYSPDTEYAPERALFNIERCGRLFGVAPDRYTPFQVEQGQHVHPKTDRQYEAACYTLRQAAKRIAMLARES